MTGSGHSPQKPEPDRVEAVERVADVLEPFVTPDNYGEGTAWMRRENAVTAARAALGVLGGAGERGAFVPPTEYVMRGGTAIQASGGEFSPSEARDLAHVVLEAMPELFDRAALAGGPDQTGEVYGTSGPGASEEVDSEPTKRAGGA